MTDGDKINGAIDSVENKPVIRITFNGPQSSEADVHVEGVNEIQIFGAAKLIEQIGMEHMARRAMESQMRAAQEHGGIALPSPQLVREMKS